MWQAPSISEDFFSSSCLYLETNNKQITLKWKSKTQLSKEAQTFWVKQ